MNSYKHCNWVTLLIETENSHSDQDFFKMSTQTQIKAEDVQFKKFCGVRIKIYKTSEILNLSNECILK